MRKNKHSIRSLTAFIVTWAFIVLMVTGLVLYVVPHGRVAYWVHWSLVGLEKDQWAWVHMIFGGIVIVAGISKRMDLDLDKALEALRVNDIAFDGPRDTLEAIARRNEMTPMAVYALISRHEKVSDAPSAPMTAAEIEARYMGTGLGRKAVSVLCQTAGLEVAACLARLSDAGIAAAADDTVRAVAEAHGRRPMDLLIIVLEGKE
jgi:hypothetical protein